MGGQGGRGGSGGLGGIAPPGAGAGEGASGGRSAYGMGALYGPGTEKSVGNQKTRVKPEFFEQKEEVAKVAIAFNQAANALARVAAEGDKAAIAKAFGDVGKSCKGCHDQFRMD